MKKFLSLTLVLVLILSLGLVAFADDEAPEITTDDGEELEMGINCCPPGCGDPDPDPDPEVTCVEIKKTIDTPNASLFLEEKFKFTIEKIGNIPSFNSNHFYITVAAGETEGTVCLDLPDYDVPGEYQYRIREVRGDTQGMDYDTNVYVLNVYYVYDDDGNLVKYAALVKVDRCGKYIGKAPGFINKLKTNDLKVEKVVTGNVGNRNIDFEIKVTFKDSRYMNKTIEDVVIEDSLGSGIETDLVFNGNGWASLTLSIKDGQVYTFKNLPYEMKWEVVETENHDHEVSYKNKTGKIGSCTSKSTITNHKNIKINTGINLDTAPYIMIMAGALLGLGAFTRKKKY